MSEKPLTERLRSHDRPYGWVTGEQWCEYNNPDGPEAADHIDALEATQAELVEALRRLAEAADACDPRYEDAENPIQPAVNDAHTLLAKLEAEKPLERPAS